MVLYRSCCCHSFIASQRATFDGLDVELLQIVSVHSDGIMVNEPGAGLSAL